MKFRQAVMQIPDLVNEWQSGLKACMETVRDKIVTDNTRLITGSIDLDAALRNKEPNSPRWDYAIGYGKSETERAIWVEVHPASSDSIVVMLKKLAWLKSWLSTSAEPLRVMTHGDFFWLATQGTISITPNSSQAKRLAVAGLRGPVRRVKIS